LLLGSWHSIVLGKDRITGMEQKSYLSHDLISALNSKNVFFLFQATRTHRSGSFLNDSKVSLELALPANLATEWTSFFHQLASTTIQLKSSDDQSMWTRGNQSGYLIAHNVYSEISNYNWNNNIGGWRHCL